VLNIGAHIVRFYISVESVYARSLHIEICIQSVFLDLAVLNRMSPLLPQCSATTAPLVIVILRLVRNPDVRYENTACSFEITN
jgi:hypothetical protein